MNASHFTPVFYVVGYEADGAKHTRYLSATGYTNVWSRATRYADTNGAHAAATLQGITGYWLERITREVIN